MSSKPTNLEEAVLWLRETSAPEDLEKFRKTEFETACVRAHHSIGRWIRNEWGLWQDSPLALWFKNELHVGHPDDMSSMIIAAVWTDLNGQPRRTEKLFAEFQDHWRRFGVSTESANEPGKP